MGEDEIQERIQEKLTEIEQKEHVTILHCVESGSRAWGFASPDSDYDVRFVYLRRTEDYLRLDPVRDVIEWQLDDVFDINGWDVRKYLQLLHKSNPTAFEWNTSLFVYRTHPAWEAVREVIPKCFSCKTAAFHYLSIARNNLQNGLQGEQVKLKKYFYVLRPLLACRWILEHKTPPPMQFSSLTSACFPRGYLPLSEYLLRKKMQADELETVPRIEALHSFIDVELPLLEKAADAIAPDEGIGWEPLNQVFLTLLAPDSEHDLTELCL
ncbi:MAG: nucleotidyltransferase domain-containing protein [Oscillospiraceae bacterium]|nr:nucleotidyltransferase domain-containing protein [Oscillospiraceae bacterium]